MQQTEHRELEHNTPPGYVELICWLIISSRYIRTKFVRVRHRVLPHAPVAAPGRSFGDSPGPSPSDQRSNRFPRIGTASKHDRHVRC